MRLDYYCPVIVRTAKGKAVTHIAKLKKLDGFISNAEGADFTDFMDDDVEGAELIGAPLALEFISETQSLFARVGFYPAKPLSDRQRAQLTDYVAGQFLDGFGSHPLSLRKGLSRYEITFATDAHVDGADRVAQYPHACNYEAPDYAFIRGPFEINAPRPTPKPTRQTQSQAKAMEVAATNGDLDTVKTLIASGCPVDIMVVPKESFETSMTALGWAANRGHIDLLDYLITQGANPNAKTSRGDSLLMMADTPETIQRLLEAGADPSLENNSGMDTIAYYRDQASHFEKNDDEDWEDPMREFNVASAKAYHDKIAAIENWKAAKV